MCDDDVTFKVLIPGSDMQSFNFKQEESLDIVSTTWGLFLLLSRKTQQYSIKNQCHRRRKSGEYSVSLAKSNFQRQSRAKKKKIAEFLKSTAAET